MYEYVLKDQAVQIIKYTGEDKRAEVPDQIEGFPVKAIGDYAFSGTPVTEILQIPSQSGVWLQESLI